jgi:hypothetical protein
VVAAGSGGGGGAGKTTPSPLIVDLATTRDLDRSATGEASGQHPVGDIHSARNPVARRSILNYHPTNATIVSYEEKAGFGIRVARV